MRFFFAAIAALGALFGGALPALAFDHTHAGFDAVLKEFREGDRVNYAKLKINPEALEAYREQLAAVTADEFAKFSASEQKAYWINAYNAYTIKSIVNAYPVPSIREIKGVWKERTWPAGGRQVTLDEIEHEILRPLGDPRVHAALNCASLGCPALFPEAFKAATLDAQLDEAARAWARDDKRNNVDAAEKKANVSKIFDWYGKDFVAKYYKEDRFPELDEEDGAAVGFLYEYADAADRNIIDAGIEDLDYIKYNWSLNDSM
ncbi:DUF547 domain-containing protein [bacterium]|nr:DUF547 domain-containing protein [bacterium]